MIVFSLCVSAQAYTYWDWKKWLLKQQTSNPVILSSSSLSGSVPVPPLLYVGWKIYMQKLPISYSETPIKLSRIGYYSRCECDRGIYRGTKESVFCSVVGSSSKREAMSLPWGTATSRYLIFSPVFLRLERLVPPCHKRTNFSVLC